MIGKVNLAKGFYGAINYVLNKDGAKILSVSGVRSQNALIASKDFEAIRALKPQVRMAVWHASISFSPMETISDHLMMKIAEDYMKSSDLAESQFLLVRHFDQPHSHFHLIANRVKFNGGLVSDRWSKNRIAKVCDQLEEKYGLIVARNQSPKKITRDKKHSCQLKKEYVKEAINQVITLDKVENLNEMIALLRAHEIELKLHTQKTGRINGISFKYDKFSVKGSSLGAAFKYKKIQDCLELNRQRRRNKTMSHDRDDLHLHHHLPFEQDILRKSSGKVAHTEKSKNDRGLSL